MQELQLAPMHAGCVSYENREGNCVGSKSDESKARTERIQSAFLEAKRLEKGPFNLTGRGYEPRATLHAHFARMLSGFDLPSERVSKGYSKPNFYPLRLVSRAAQLMGVDPSEFTSTVQRASEGPGPRPASWIAPDGTVHRRISRGQLVKLLGPRTKLTRIYFFSKRCSDPLVVIRSDYRGFVFDEGVPGRVLNKEFIKFDEVFVDFAKDIVTIKNGDEIRVQYRVEGASKALRAMKESMHS